MTNEEMLVKIIEIKDRKLSSKSRIRSNGIRELGKLCGCGDINIHVGNYGGYKVFRCDRCSTIQVFESGILIDSKDIVL